MQIKQIASCKQRVWWQVSAWSLANLTFPNIWISMFCFCVQGFLSIALGQVAPHSQRKRLLPFGPCSCCERCWKCSCSLINSRSCNTVGHSFLVTINYHLWTYFFKIPMPVLYGFGCMQRWKWEQYLEVLRRRTERNQKGICCCPAGSAIPCTGPLALSGDDETSTLWRSCKSHYLGRLCRQQNRLQ